MKIATWGNFASGSIDDHDVSDAPLSAAGANTMTIDEYGAWAATLGKQPLSANKEMLSYLGLGLAGEAGEVADRIKKFLRDGEWDAGGLAEELGDVVYFWTCLCLCAGRKPSQVLEASRRKIETRSPELLYRTSERSRTQSHPRVPDE